jgi:hypothetical protein
VECLQNISKHADDFGSNDYMFSGRGIFLVAKGKDDYTVTTGNAVDNIKIPDLKKLLEQVNQLEKDELTELYKKQIKEGRLSDKGGAGLGFIDIKRKTGKNLEYHFLAINEQTSFFLLTSTISRVS